MNERAADIILVQGNSVRSQTAEAFLRLHGGDRFEAYGAGLNPRGVNSLAVQTMQAVGLDISGQSSKGVDTYPGKMPFQYLVTLRVDAEKGCLTAWPGGNVPALRFRGSCGRRGIGGRETGQIRGTAGRNRSKNPELAHHDGVGQS